MTRNDLEAMSTPDLVRLAHALAALLRERVLGDEPEAVQQARELHATLAKAGDEGAFLGALKGVLITIPLD